MYCLWCTDNHWLLCYIPISSLFHTSNHCISINIIIIIIIIIVTVVVILLLLLLLLYLISHF